MGEPPPDESRSSRRHFLSQLAALSASLTIAAPTVRAEPSREKSKPEIPDPERSESLLDIVLKVNGQEKPLKIDPRVTLLDAVRDRLNLSGTKKGCDHGACGACTVLIDGRRVLSCLTLAVMAQGKEITTIEGLAHGDELHPVQAAFVTSICYRGVRRSENTTFIRARSSQKSLSHAKSGPDGPAI